MVCLFGRLMIIGSGIISAKFTGTAELLQLPSVSSSTTSENGLLLGSGLFTAAVMTLGTTYLAMKGFKRTDAESSDSVSNSVRSESPNKRYTSALLVSDTLQGILFAFALGYTGRPTSLLACCCRCKD